MNKGKGSGAEKGECDCGGASKMTHL